MFIKCDASQLEWRTILELSRDWVGINELINKEDVHSKNQVAFELPSRLIAKRFLFRIIFRGSGWSFANDPDFMHVSTDPKFWDALNEKFFTKYHGIDACHNRWKDLVMQGKPIEGPLGRSWTISMKPGFQIPWTTLSNYPTQGSGADIMMIARISAWNKIKAAGIPCDWVATVHDDIKVDTEKQYVQPIVDIFHQSFDDIPKNVKKLFGYEWVTPMDCECQIGMNFKDMEKIGRST